MKTDESFYIKILLWAYEKTSSGVGFTEAEMLKEFDLKNSGGEQYRLYLKLFRDGTNDNHPIIDHFYNKPLDDGSEIGYWCLSDKGMSSAIDYIDLKEARENSESAKCLAFWSIGISIFVGISQILIAVIQMLIQSK